MPPNRVLELKERVFEYVERNGPLLPSVIAKEFRSTNIFISALLSELSTNKRIKITKSKIGGSPLYYCKTQEYKLPEVLKNHIGQKPKEAMDLLREKKVLRDRDCLPFERVALRELEDFAVPVKLVIHDTEELFWKWFLLPDTEAKDLIGKQLENIYAPAFKEPEILVSETPKESEKAVERLIEPEKKPKRRKKFLQSVLVEKKGEPVEFDRLIVSFLRKREIKILEKKVIGKKEINLLVQVSSPLGELSYFVKARDKKSLTEGDMLLAFTEGQNLKLPTIFLSSGDITKKAQEYISKNLKGLSFLRLK